MSGYWDSTGWRTRSKYLFRVEFLAILLLDLVSMGYHFLVLVFNDLGNFSAASGKISLGLNNSLLWRQSININELYLHLSISGSNKFRGEKTCRTRLSWYSWLKTDVELITEVFWWDFDLYWDTHEGFCSLLYFTAMAEKAISNIFLFTWRALVSLFLYFLYIKHNQGLLQIRI